MKEYLVTTGLCVAYIGTFDVRLYNIQSPSHESVPQDFSSEYFNRIMMQRKQLSKKSKNEVSLAQIIKTIQAGGA